MYNNSELLCHRYLMVLAVFFMPQVVHANSYIGEALTKHSFFRTVETSHYNVVNTTNFIVPSLANLLAITHMGSAIPETGSYKGSQQIYLQYIPISQRISEYEYEYESDVSDLPELGVLMITIGFFGTSVILRRRDETAVCCF